MMAKQKIYFGTYSKGEGNGLFRGEFDDESGEIILNDTINIESPSYLQFDKTNPNIIYGVSEIGRFDDENGGALFSVDVSDPKKMRLIDIKPTHGKHPCHLCAKDNFIFVANYSEGSLSIFEKDDNGNIKSSCQSIHHFGKGTNPNRQKQSHIHFATITPDNKYLAVCDLGMDKVFLYPYSAENGLSTNAKIIDCPSGSGPRHLTFSNDGEFMYVLTELENSVLAYEYGGYSEFGIEYSQQLPTLPPDFKGNSTSAAIHVSPDGKFLATSNRGHDSIAVFKFLDDNKFTFSHVMTGKEPRDFGFSPDGKWLLTANQNDDSVTVFKINNDHFIQTFNISIPKPVCIVFGGMNG